MKVTSFFYLLALLVVSYFTSIMGSGCAQIGSPVGGSRDSLPPRLVSVTPPNFSTNYNTKKIQLVFDEYVHLQNVQQNLLVTPVPKVLPNVDYRLRTVTIKLKDTLLPNTTYNIDLGKAIQGINENIPFSEFNYVFSTGDRIDSLTLRGNVRMAQTGAVDTTIVAMLYNDLSDTAVQTHQPKYIAKVDNQGNFTFKYLAPDTYHLYALKDETGRYFYVDESQLFAFSTLEIKPGDTVASFQLYAYNTAIVEEEKFAAAKPDDSLQFTASLSGDGQDLLSPLTLTFNKPLEKIDTGAIRLTDTLFNELGAALIPDSNFRKITVQYPWQGSRTYLLIVEKGFATDTLGNALPENDTLRFESRNESDYGSLEINFTNLEKYNNPVVQLISNSKIVKSFPLTGTRLYAQLFPPGEYSLRILEDRNGNGIWDPGDYEKKLQPEIVHLLNNEVSVRANWENEYDIAL